MANRQSGPQDLSIGDIICQKICLIYLPTPSLYLSTTSGRAQERGPLPPLFPHGSPRAHVHHDRFPFQTSVCMVQSLPDRILQVFGDTPFCSDQP